MADLSVRLGGLELKNPIVVASGPLTATSERIRRAADCGAAAVCLKHAMIEQQFAARPRWYAEKGLGIVVSGDPRLDFFQAETLIEKTKASCDIKVIANMSGSPTSTQSWGELAKRFEDAGADAIELNLNCPNLHKAGAAGPTLGANLGQDAKSCASVVRAVKETVSIPVMAKLPTEGGKIMETAEACARAGVDILNIHAGFRAAPGLDIYHGGRLLYPGSPQGNFGGSCGPWSRLISNRFVADIAAAFDVPIMGGGGISQWEHVIETIMFGASAVQVCSSVMFEGFELIQTLLSGISSFMERQRYQTIEKFRGAALKNILPPQQMPYSSVAADIREDACVGCGACTKLAACDAIERDGKKCAVDQKKCAGCGLCVSVCPVKAISMKPFPQE